MREPGENNERGRREESSKVWTSCQRLLPRMKSTVKEANEKIHPRHKRRSGKTCRENAGSARSITAEGIESMRLEPNVRSR
jgi:hypothetical protein